MPTHPVVSLRRVMCAIKTQLDARYPGNRFGPKLQSFEDRLVASERPSAIHLNVVALRHWSAWADRQPIEMGLLSGSAGASWLSTLDGRVPIVFRRYQTALVRLLLSIKASTQAIAQIEGVRPGSSQGPSGRSPSPGACGGAKGDREPNTRLKRVNRFLECAGDVEAARRFALLLDDWAAMKPATQKTYENAADAWLSWASTEDARGPKLMSTERLRQYSAVLETRCSSQYTVSLYLFVLRSMGEQLQWLDADAHAFIVQAVRSSRRRVEGAVREGPFLDWDDIQSMLAVVDLRDPLQVRDAALTLVMYETLVLPQHIMQSDFNELSDTAFRAECIEERADGGSRIGRFSLSPLATQWLTQWSRMMGGQGPLFQCSRDNFGRRLCEWAWRAGVRMERLDTSAIRAGAVRALARNGADARALQEIGGRKSSRFALRFLAGESAPIAVAKLAHAQGRTQRVTNPQTGWRGKTPHFRANGQAKASSPQMALFA
jgi:site-specific recombinase XerC